MRGVVELPKELESLGLLLVERLEDVTRRFDEQLESPSAPVTNLVKHVERYRGKMLRPSLVLLCGMVTGDGTTGADHVTAGAVCEMVHMATLVHDDVLDEADVRRRGPTVNNLHGNEPAVILGDYLFSAAYHLCSQIQHAVAARAAALKVGEASMAMCAGELLQLHHRRDFALSEDEYYAIVAGKTGELIAASCHLGGLLSGAGDPVLASLSQFGRQLGIAFQIQDDLLDLLGSEQSVGKSVHKDLEKGKLTLPFIHHLATAPAPRRTASTRLLELAASGDISGVDELLPALQQTGSVAFAEVRARSLVAEAIASLQVLPESPARQTLELMAQAVVDRTF